MNKTHIKRQITLHELEFPINEDILEYIKFFNELIGNSDKLIKRKAKLLDSIGNAYIKNDIVIIFYSINLNQFVVDYDNLWKPFERRFDIKYLELSKLFNALLESYFNVNSDIYTIDVNLEHVVLL